MMRRILAIGWLNVQQILRSPAELVGVVVLPLALTLVFGSAFGGGGQDAVVVPVVDEDGSPFAEQVAALIDEEPSLEVELVERTEAVRRVESREVGLVVLLSEGFGERVLAGDAVIEVLRDPGSDTAWATSAVLQGVTTRMSGSVAAAFAAKAVSGAGTDGSPTVRLEDYMAADALWEPEPPVDVAGQTVIASEVRSDAELAPNNTQYSTGFTVMFIMFVTFGGAAGILEERELGTLRRLLVMPVSKGTIITGKIAGIVMTALAQSAVLVGMGVLLFKVPWGDDPLAVFVVLVSYILAVTGLGVLVSSLVRSRDQFSGLSPLISVGLSMIGGSFWPIEVVSPFMQTLARFTPPGWAMIGLTDVVARHQGLAAAALPTAVLLGFAVVTTALGVKLLEFE